MCIKKGCNTATQMCRCCIFCECNLSCYTCYDAYTNYQTGWSAFMLFEPNNADVRKKFVCFPCKRIWKSSISKYSANKVHKRSEGFEECVKSLTKIDENRPIILDKDIWKLDEEFEELITKSREVNNACPYKKHEKRTLKKDMKILYPYLYSTNCSKCASCGNAGILVGRNFRHCKSNKEWKELEEKYKNNKKGLHDDFHAYPREGTTESSNKYNEKYNNDNTIF